MKTAPLFAIIWAALLTGPSGAAPLKEASVTRIINDVRVMESAGLQRPAALSETVRDRQAVVTGVQSRAELLFADKTLTRLGASTVFTFKEGTRNMDLQRGTMLLQVPKGAGGAQIKTAAVTAAITGTTLMVEYSPGAGAADATVFPGTVPAFTPPPVPVSQGERAVASEITGPVKILVPGEDVFRPLQPGESITPGSSLMTGDGGSATVSPVPGTALRILPNTTLRVNESQAAGSTPKVRLDLKEGGVINMISRQNFQQVDYQVATPQGVCAARGTVFGIFVIGGRVLVIGAHGAAAFNGRPVGPGKAFGFGPGAGALDPQSPQFQNLLNQTLLALNQATGRGLIPGDLLTQVSQQLQKAGVPLSTGQQQLLTPPPAGPVTAGGGPSKGFAKVLVIEGEVRVFITGKPGESMLLGPGQMIIFAPDATRLPNPVDFDLETLLKTSKLIQDMEDNAQIASNASDLDNQEILLALQKQQDQLLKKLLGDTNLFIFEGNEVVQLDKDNILIVQQLIDALGGVLPGGGQGDPILFPPGTTGPLTTITGFPGLGTGTTVATNPTITDGGGVILAEGKIMTGIPAEDGTASPAEYLFGRPANAFDSQVGFDGEIPPPFAAFRFDALTINNGFPIDTSAPAAQRKLALVSESGINASFATPLNLSSLGPGGGLLLAAANGGITHTIGTVNLFGADLIYYASNGNVTVGTGATFSGPGCFTAGASGDVNFSGTATNLNEFSLLAGDEVNFNGTLSSQTVDLSTEPRFGVGTVNLTGGSITAHLLDVNASTINLGATSFGMFGPQISAYFVAPDINLLASQSYGTNINVFFTSQFGSINGNGHSLIGARGFAAIDSTVFGFDDLAIVGGDITVANGDLLIDGDLSAIAAFNPGSGRITVSGGDIGGIEAPVLSITADGDISADNIYVSDIVQALGTTSSVMANGEINFFNESGTLLAGGAVQATRISGLLGQISASALILTGAENYLDAQTIQTNLIDAPGTYIYATSISAYGTTPANALIRASGLYFNGGGIHYAHATPGGRGTDLTLELFTPFYFGGEGGASSVNTSGGPGVGAHGGDGGNLLILAPGHFIEHSSTGDIRSSGGFASGSTFRGGNGGRVRLESTDATGIWISGFNDGEYDYFVNIEAVGGFADTGTGAHSGNGGTVELYSFQGDIGLGTAQILTETRQTDFPALEKVGGTIDLRAGGEDIAGGSETAPNIGISNTRLLATGNPFGSGVSTRGGRITLQSLRNYLNPTAAIVINNSSELLALTNAPLVADMAITEIQTGDGSDTKGLNAFIQIGDASGAPAQIRSDILRIQALNPNGGIKIYAGSTLTARDQTLLYAGSLANGGLVQFLGEGSIDINSPTFLARAGTITVSSATQVNLNSTQIGLYADTRNWNSAQTAGAYGDFLVNGTTPIPNTTLVNENISGANVNVGPRNATGAPAAVPIP
jgi:hypothetical protein